MTNRLLPHPENPGQTHWQGCFRSPGHHNCAVIEVDRLRDDISRITQHVLRAGLVPDDYRWLWEDREALTSLLQGMEDAAAGRLTDGPDLEADAKLIEGMEKERSRPISVSQARRLAVQTGLSVQECQRKFVRDQMNRLADGSEPTHCPNCSKPWPPKCGPDIFCGVCSNEFLRIMNISPTLKPGEKR